MALPLLVLVAGGFLQPAAAAELRVDEADRGPTLEGGFFSRLWRDPQKAFYLGARFEPRGEVSAYANHNDRVMDRDAARFVLQGYPGIEKFKSLPCRSAKRPYLIWLGDLHLDKCFNPTQQVGPVSLSATSGLADRGDGIRDFDAAECELLTYAKKRADVLMINYDLSDHVLSRADMGFKGVTLPPPGFFRGRTPENLRTARFFLSFRGTNRIGYFRSSFVRPALLAAFRNNTRADVAVEFLGIPKWFAKDDKSRFEELLDSSYSLVPHGDGRWNYRFNDVVGACSIPVIMADNLTLPYEQLIDWSQAAIRIDEKFAGSEQGILDRLPADGRSIQRMRERVCEIHRRYFSTQTLRLDALLEAASHVADAKQTDSGMICG